LLSDYVATVLFLQGTQKLPLNILCIIARNLFNINIRNSDSDFDDVRKAMVNIRENFFKPKGEKTTAMDVSEDNNIVTQAVNNNNNMMS
jgi:hypothetical protein